MTHESRTTTLALAAVLMFGSPCANGREIDIAKITCGGFLTSGQTAMASVISWLRGYHAAKTGIIPYQSDNPYGGRLGYYCKQHPKANLIEASERILEDLDHGI
jgi:hypothetical protein